MISTKFCRYKLLKILEELSRNLDKTHRIKIQKEINFLVNYVKEEYNYDSELPRISHRFINDILNNLEDIDLLLGNIFVSESFDMPNDVKNEKEQLFLFIQNLIDKYDLSSKISVIKNRKTDIYSMLDMYAKNYGKERVIEALKSGLNIFLKQKSNIFSKKVNLTDENWQNFLKYVQEKYPIETIEKYLNKGLISNLVFETKNFSRHLSPEWSSRKILNSVKFIYEIFNEYNKVYIKIIWNIYSACYWYCNYFVRPNRWLHGCWIL